MTDNVTLQLEKTSVQELHLTKSKEQFDISKYAFSLGLAVGFPDEPDDCNHFAITFKSEFQIKEGFILKVEFQSIFKTNVPIDDNFKNSKFITVNAPAIAFPFLRAFVATFLTNSGFEPIILPSINFLNLKQKLNNS